MRKYRAISAHLIAICALSLLLVACGHPASTLPATFQRDGTLPATFQPTGARRVASARAILTSASPSNHFPPFDRTTTSATKAQQLYNALLALPVMPAGTYNCPADFGNVYHLMFYDDSARLVATATVKPDGCETAVLPDGSHRWAATDQSFWSTFAAAMDVPTSALFPRPNPDGPSAPTALPS